MKPHNIIPANITHHAVYHFNLCSTILSTSPFDPSISAIGQDPDTKLVAWAWHCVHSKTQYLVPQTKSLWISHETAQYNSRQYYPPCSISFQPVQHNLKHLTFWSKHISNRTGPWHGWEKREELTEGLVVHFSPFAVQNWPLATSLVINASFSVRVWKRTSRKTEEPAFEEVQKQASECASYTSSTYFPPSLIRIRMRFNFQSQAPPLYRTSSFNKVNKTQLVFFILFIFFLLPQE